jgi:hypothetical protein
MVYRAEAGIQVFLKTFWIPVYTGMTDEEAFQSAKIIRKS